MKRLLVAFVGLLASVAIAAPVSAGYPPGSPTVESSSGTPAPGASIDIHLTGFCPSTSVVLDIDGTTVGGGTTNGSGSVTIPITAPSTAGTHTITATMQNSRRPRRKGRQTLLEGTVLISVMVDEAAAVPVRVQGPVLVRNLARVGAVLKE